MLIKISEFYPLCLTLLSVDYFRVKLQKHPKFRPVGRHSFKLDFDDHVASMSL